LFDNHQWVLIGAILLLITNFIAMKKILVPFDFSKPAINAFRFALDIAAKDHGIVHLLHVIELPVLHDSVLMPVLNFEQELLKELQEKAENEFKKIREKIDAKSVEVKSKVIFGAPSKKILAYAKDESVDLIVMGSHGATGIREFFVGSNAEKIVRNSHVPVLVVKHWYKGHVKNIIFPNDLDTENQEELIVKVKALQHFFKAHLHLVWINTPLNFTSDTLTYERMNAFVKYFGLTDYTFHVFNHPNEEDGIIKFTQLIKGDLIAMATHGRKGISHLINGSMSEDVVNHTDSLVWTYVIKNESAYA
jgi:nucleotide-binding universal stress UspA family protein